MDTETLTDLELFDSKIYYLQKQVIEMESIIHTIHYDYLQTVKMVKVISFGVCCLAVSVICINFAIRGWL